MSWETIKTKLRILLLVSPLVWMGLFSVVALSAYGVYYIKKNPQAQEEKTKVVEETKEVIEEVKEEVAKKPPKYSGSGSSRKSGSVTIVSDGPITDEDVDKLNNFGSLGSASEIYYNDTTGRYPDLGNTLKSYINNQLLHSSDLPFMYEIEMIDCSSCSYAGLYTGSYYTEGSDIIKAYGWIKLNTYYYKSSPYFEDYMKLILSHEYGHHYTLYHKWVDLDIPWGERFPNVYYQIRPLSYADTTWDYSLGWSNCDAEIIAEDYSYLYSNYGSHAMAGVRGYPSQTTNTWLRNMTSNPQEEPPPQDQAPTVSIISPSDGAEVSGSVTVSANASDDIGVSRVEFYIDGSLFASDSSAPYSTSLNTLVYANGSHTILAKVYDVSQNSQDSISVTVNNLEGGDEENPTVSITQPAENPYNWLSSDLIVEAEGSDNVAVTKIEFYVNDYLVAEESGNYIIRLWIFASTPPGSYTLKAKAYDAAGNTAEISVTVNKS